MVKTEQLEKVGLKYDECFPISLDIIKDVLVKDEKWEYLEKGLKRIFKDLYEHRLMDKPLLDIEVCCETTDTERLHINMIFEDPGVERRNDPWKSYLDTQ